jgi:V8-like Glu-specific endopeptidase
MKIKYLALVLLTVFVSVEAAAQSSPPRKDIPAIAKAANGAIVSIVMSDKDGHPLAQGSGFLVSKDGLVVTNYHVIAEGTSAVVKLPDGAFYVVEGVVASDKARDVAVVKAHGGNFRTLTLGNSDRLQVGEEVVAIGNPLSLESTVSNGIVSGIRTVEKLGGKFLQITTPISPGSSGGPLFNMAGDVVGITTMYLEGGENLNFAIPVNDAKSLLQNRSAGLRNLPDEPLLTEAKPKETQIIKYRIVSYNPDTGVVIVRHGNQLLTAVVTSSNICKIKVVETPESSNDCEDVLSMAGRLVGQDLPPSGTHTSGAKQKCSYFVNDSLWGLLWVQEFCEDWIYPAGGLYKNRFRNEFLAIKRVEAAQP